jgi:ribosomal protein S6
MNKLSLNDFKIALSDVEPEHYFQAKDGTVVKNLIDLAKAIELMDESIFNHHVSDHRNDFAAWLEDIIGDTELAKKIRNLRDKERMIEEIEERINQIRSLERRLRSNEAVKPRMNFSDNANIKEYIYGLVIGVIIGVLIGLLL